MADFVLFLVVLAAILLVAGAYFMWKRTGELKQPVLMLILAAIAIGNVLIWIVPGSDGTTPLDQAEAAEAG